MATTDTVVMKFGGTSLATAAHRARAVAHVCARRAEGLRVVVVVSAMGRAGEPYATDTLLSLLGDLPAAPAREIDALIACGEEISAAVMAALLCEAGTAAVSLRGYQAGIMTDEQHRDAAIREIRPACIERHLQQGSVVVVTGFQGMSSAGDITTLGRGGSDTTAVALAAALDAVRAEIYTDVAGVHTADPDVVADARAVPEMTYEESAELAFKGAEILHPRAAEHAHAAGVRVQVRSLDGDEDGTWLVPDEGRWSATSETLPRTTAVTSAGNIAQLEVRGGDFFTRPDLLEQVLGRIAAGGISLDMFDIEPTRFACTLNCAAAPAAAAALADLGVQVRINACCAKVTLIGGGIHGIPGILHRVVRALARAGIGVHQSVDSNMIISVLVDADREADAVRALHAEFFE